MEFQQLNKYPELNQIIKTADHIDTHSGICKTTLVSFTACAMSYAPAWMIFLFRVRGVFVKFLGLHQPELKNIPNFSADTLPIKPGTLAGFFEVFFYENDQCWVSKIDDKHLSAYIAIYRDEADRNIINLTTIVKYHKWSGPVYFNIIRPFHHLVVYKMIRAGEKAA